MRLGALLLFCSALLGPLNVGAQLSRWLVRGLDGVHELDLSQPVPVAGPLIPGLGTGGEEDVNMMTDAAGNVLFCTAVSSSGEIQVWDANYALMPNGDGLYGHSSTLQSAISPIPCYPNRYFILHLVTGVGDLYYSIVDMSLNGGLGEVVLKNIPVGTGFTEGMAVSHQLPNGCRWLFTSVRNGNTYEVVRCLISQSGIGPATTIATVSTVAPAYNFNEIELSPDNTRLAMSVYTTSPNEPDVALWELALTPGTLSNPQTASASDDPIIGLQFSPLGNYLYFVGNGNIDAMDFGRIDVATLLPELIDANVGRYLTMTELGGNGRIYVGMNYNYDAMAEVAFPDAPALAAIQYNHNAVFIASSGSRPGTPNAIEGEPPGSTVTPGYIAFSATSVGSCDTYQFVDSTCLSTWWEWDFGDGTVSNDAAPIHQFPAGTFDITLRVVACGDTLTLVQPGMVNSISEPVVAAFSAEPDTVCTGSPVQFNNTSTNAIMHEWDFDDGAFNDTIDPLHIYSESGSYLVRLVAANDCSADTVLVPVTVLGTLAQAVIVSDPCHTTIEVSSATENVASLLWLFGDGLNSPDSTATHDYAVPGAYDVQLIADPGTACADTLITTITVGNGPVAAISSTNLCDLQVSFLATGSLGAMLTWQFGDGTTSDLANVTHTYPNIGPHSVTLIAVDDLGCSDTAFATVSPLPSTVAAFSLLTGPCDTEQAFESSSIGALQLLWNFGDGGSSSEQEPSHTYAQPGEYTVTLIANPGASCADTIIASVTVAEHPIAAFTDSLGCSMDAYFTSTAQNSDELDWDLGDGSSSNGTLVEHIYSTPGTYSVLLLATNQAGCADSVSLAIEIPPLVLASFSAGVNECSAQWEFTSASLNATQLVWDLGDGATSSVRDPSHTYAQQGAFLVQLVVIDARGCRDTSSVTIEATDGGIPAGIFVPNCFTPNGDGVNDQFAIGGIPECFSLELLIFNRWGELIFEDDALLSWNGEVDGRAAPDGTYVFLLKGSVEQRFGTVTLLR